MGKRLAVDVGGTFIDFVSLDPETGELTVEKAPSTGALEARLFEGIDALGLAVTDIDVLVHGSTQVINTIVQETGAKVGLLTTQGFRDVLELGRGSREEIYNLFYRPPPPLVPRHLRFEVKERMDFEGRVVTPLDEDSARAVLTALVDRDVEAVAICLLHSYVNPVHERRLRDLAQEILPGLPISISSDVVREWREFERTSTTVLNAYTQPRMSTYLARLDAGLRERSYNGAFAVMQSSGGITASSNAQKVPIRTVQSGPAGGVIGAARLGRLLDIGNLVVADVGGTTFDVSLVANHTLLERSSVKLGGRPVLQPTIDIVSVGAGGGSIARVDEEGGLQVGPQSAQADPGPVCFGLGGKLATVTDAQMLLGYFDPETYLGRRLSLDISAAREAIRGQVAEPLGLSVEHAAAGIVHLAATNMAYAVRQITVERGYDPREFSLLCIGGGGGLFASALLRELGMKQAIAPVHPAVFSAWGLLNAEYREDAVCAYVQAFTDITPAALTQVYAPLVVEVNAAFTAQGLSRPEQLEYHAELRYLGQEHTLKVALTDEDLKGSDFGGLRLRFDTLYEHTYAHALPNHALEFVALRLTAIASTAPPRLTKSTNTNRPAVVAGDRVVRFELSEPRTCPLFARSDLPTGTKISGPAVVEEWNSTILIGPGQTADIDDYGNLFIRSPVGEES